MPYGSQIVDMQQDSHLCITHKSINLSVHSTQMHVICYLVDFYSFASVVFSKQLAAALIGLLLLNY